MTDRSLDADRAQWRAAWQAARREVQRDLPDPAAPDEAEAALLIAGYLEGSLDEPARERVEAWLARDEAALDLLVATRAALQESAGHEAPDEAPASLVGRAQGIVRVPVRSAKPSGLGGFFSPLRVLWQPVGMATAAACLLACVVGFELGRSGYASVVVSEYLVTQQAGGFDLLPSADDLL